MNKSILALAVLSLIGFAASPAFATATVAQQEAACKASGGNYIPHPGGTPECNHPGPAPTAAHKDLTAPATPMAHTFRFEGAIWTIVSGPPEAVSAVHMIPNSATFCPQRRVKFEHSTKGPAMTREQKFRGDKRWHVVCVW